MSKLILGVSSGFHDAAVSVIKDGNILFAGHSERYSKAKHDAHVCAALLDEALPGGIVPDIVSYYETPVKKKLRQVAAGQYKDAMDITNFTAKRYLNDQIGYSPKAKFVHQSHHLSHAAGGFQTSPFDRATVVVIDAIGEWDTISIMGAEYDDEGFARYTPLWKQSYPHSIGLLYSAMTKRVGLRPLDEEYILMGMAGYGTPVHLSSMLNKLIDSVDDVTLLDNVHLGVDDDYLKAAEGVSEEQHNYDIAASTQLLTEILIAEVMDKAKAFNWSRNLVYTGGVALNCSANRDLGKYFNNIWIMPNPGDAGSSLGAAALAYGKKLNWEGPYLGTNIPGPYPTHGLLHELETTKIVGVASGRAEFGPRALGNRSLLADPRGPDIKDRVNEIKRRQMFRPFAPVILAEHVAEYFEMPVGFQDSDYMQVTAYCKRPKEFPAIVHIDGTSRVQTVPKKCKSGIRQLLEAWYLRTGCPMLLNTSLNIRNEPMVDDRADAERFQTQYGIKVLS